MHNDEISISDAIRNSHREYEMRGLGCIAGAASAAPFN